MCQARETGENGLRLDAVGNLISSTVLSVGSRPLPQTTRSRPALRGFFAPGTPAAAAAAPGGSGGPPADVDELAATLGRPSRATGVEVVEVAAATPAAGVEPEALSRPGTAAAGPVVEPGAQPAKRGRRRVTRRVYVLADGRPAARCPPGAEDLQVPAKPRWLLSIPDAISQLEQLDRTLLTRRDVERLFGVSKARAATLMQTFGAELVGNQRTLPRTKLLQQLKKHRGRAAFRGEEERRSRLVAELQQARLTGVRFKVPAETMSAKLANLPAGVSVARGRIEVRFDGAENALERLFALAQALGNDYVRFEELVGR